MQDHYSAPQNLPAVYEALLELVRERDRLMLEYVAAVQFSNEQYSEWNRNSWKRYARNHLALIQAVRPLTYTDYRHRVTILSPTLGVVGPYRLVTGWMLDSEQELRREAESAAVLALFGEGEPSATPAPALAEAVPLPILPLPLVLELETLEPLLPVVGELPMHVEAASANDANREAAIELRKRNRARLQANRPAVLDALNSPTLICNPLTGKPPLQ